MATTPTPISAANILFHTRLKQPSSLLSPAFFLKCSSPLNINCITDTKTSKTSKNGTDSVLLDGFDKTTERNESSEIRKQETEPLNMVEYIKQLEASVSEVARLQKQLSEARATMDEGEYAKAEISPIKKNEKWESVKAASVSAIVGTLASLPISLMHVAATYDLTVTTAVTMITCALYGATYRYTIRRDLDDFHLKTGTCAAFGIVKGVATLDGQRSLDVLSGAICVYENVIIFLLAAAGLDICYKLGILSPFPLEKRTKV